MTGQVFHRRLAHDYPVVSRGEGVYLYDTQGRRYMDGSGGALVVNIGHGVSDVADAIEAQLRRVAFAHGTHFTSEPLEAYARALGTVSPIANPRVYLVCGGSEAIETALKLGRTACVARGQPHRTKFIARWGSYHGATLGALSVSGRTPLRKDYAPQLLDVSHIPPAYCYRCPFGLRHPGCDLACASELEREILRQGPDTVAAFIGEPVVGATLGAVVPPEGYWLRVRDICDRFGVLWIADEVMTGFGRTGRWFAVEHWGAVPDILVSAKGASGGYYPLGVVLCAPELVESIREGAGVFAHGFTHANSVLGATAGLAVLDLLKSRQLVSASARMGRYLNQELHKLNDLPAVGDVRGLGLMAGVELVAQREGRRPFPRAAGIAERVQAEALTRGLVVYYGTAGADGCDGDAVLVGPPFTISRAQIDELVGTLREAIRAATEH
jgi:adenosylmethionine-8-amino-7-oxononanoate aminotransferase